MDQHLGTDAFKGFRKLLGKERGISGVISNVEAIKCAAFNITFHEGSNKVSEYIQPAAPVWQQNDTKHK